MSTVDILSKDSPGGRCSCYGLTPEGEARRGISDVMLRLSASLGDADDPVATEPLSNLIGWTRFAPGELLMYGAGRRVDPAPARLAQR